MHTPVLLQQVLSHIHKERDTRYIDCTLGEGGHTRALARMGLRVLALDADAEQIRAFEQVPILIEERNRITLVQSNFAFVDEVAEKHGFKGADGILFDLGLSMSQINSERGFSYKHLHQPLDMVIDTRAKQRGTARAADVVACYDKEELVNMFETLSERLHAGALAEAIIARRVHAPIKTVGDLVSALQGIVENSGLSAVFQALRMEVNEELEGLKMGLEGAFNTVKTGGTIQTITFHSVEDRTVKLWARKRGLIEIAKYVGRELSRESYEQSAVLRVYKVT